MHMDMYMYMYRYRYRYRQRSVSQQMVMGTCVFFLLSQAGSFPSR